MPVHNRVFETRCDSNLAFRGFSFSMPEIFVPWPLHSISTPQGYVTIRLAIVASGRKCKGRTNCAALRPKVETIGGDVPVIYPTRTRKVNAFKFCTLTESKGRRRLTINQK